MNWNYIEFKTYVLLEAAYGDLVFTQDEQDEISKKINPETYTKMLNEFEADTDYERIEKISEGAKIHCDTADKKMELIEKVKSLFEADGNFDTMEKNLMMFLKKMI